MARAMQRSEQRAPQGVVIRTALNRFDFDRRRIPPGMTYEWKRKNVLGKEDTEHLINLESNGWTAVPPERHPELAGRRTVGEEIVKGDMVLMERPEEITEEARELDKFAAGFQYASQLQRLGLQGHRAAGKGVRRTYEPIPEDE